jgi:hypothetical protein
VCDYVLELWKWKDVRERLVMRFTYTRLMPAALAHWSKYIDYCKQLRYAVMHAKRQLMRSTLRHLQSNAAWEAEQKQREMEQ